MARKANETAAPSAKPRDRKKAMMAPAVSASCCATFLFRDNTGTKIIRGGTGSSFHTVLFEVKYRYGLT